MRGQTVELPRLKRARGGWVMYGAYEDSICQYHQFCCYSGDERGRCAECHSNTHLTDEHGELPPTRLAPCLCPKCGELFTSITAFNKHKRPNFGCYNPEKRGLILVDQKGWLLWANPGSRPEDI